VKIGLVTDSVSHLRFEQALDLAQQLGLSAVEIATGNWSQAPHADLDALVSSEEARSEFIGKISSRGLALSALTANGNNSIPPRARSRIRLSATRSRWPVRGRCRCRWGVMMESRSG
jgi:sugar phosphate isomerase/epimerase